MGTTTIMPTMMRRGTITITSMITGTGTGMTMSMATTMGIITTPIRTRAIRMAP